jgi:hypothetical protein
MENATALVLGFLVTWTPISIYVRRLAWPIAAAI